MPTNCRIATVEISCGKIWALIDMVQARWAHEFGGFST